VDIQPDGPGGEFDQVLLAVAVMITAVVVASSVAKKPNLGSIAALFVVGMALGPHSPRPLLTGHVDELQAIGDGARAPSTARSHVIPRTTASSTIPTLQRERRVRRVAQVEKGGQARLLRRIVRLFD